MVGGERTERVCNDVGVGVCDQERRRLAIGMGAFVFAPFAACRRVDPRPLMVGVNPWAGFDALVLAREQKMLTKQTAKIVELPSLTDTVRQFRNGLLQVAAVPLGEAMRLADQGLALAIVAVCAESAGADVVMAAPWITSISELGGETVVVEESTSGLMVLHRMLQFGGLAEDRVRVLYQPAVDHARLLRSGQAMAAVSYQPVARVLKDGGYIPLFGSDQMPGELVNVLVARTEVIREHQEQLDALLSTWALSTSLMLADPAGAATRLAPGSGLSVQEYLDAVAGMRMFRAEQALGLIDAYPPALAQNAERLTSTMLTTGMLSGKPNWGALIDPDPLARALRGARGKT